MKEEINNKEMWGSFRKEILHLIMLYNQVKEFSKFNETKIKHIKNFFYLSKSNALCAFYIKTGFVLKGSAITFKTFLDNDSLKDLEKCYEEKIIKIRDGIYAHNVPTKAKTKILDKDIDVLIGKIIKYAKLVDKKFDDMHCYDFIGGNDGVCSLEGIIKNHIEFNKIQDILLKNNFSCNLKLNIITGEITI